MRINTLTSLVLIASLAILGSCTGGGAGGTQPPGAEVASDDSGDDSGDDAGDDASDDGQSDSGDDAGGGDAADDAGGGDPGGGAGVVDEITLLPFDGDQGSVRLATTLALVATYAAGGDGGAPLVGATLTMNATGPLSIDGVTVQVGNKVLVKDQANQAHNGIYTVTSAGANATGGGFTPQGDFPYGLDYVYLHYEDCDDTGPGTEMCVGFGGFGDTNADGTRDATLIKNAITAANGAFRIINGGPGNPQHTWIISDIDDADVIIAWNAIDSGEPGPLYDKLLIKESGVTITYDSQSVSTFTELLQGWDPVYTIGTISAGTAASPAVLTRNTAFDNSVAGEIDQYKFATITAGTANTGGIWYVGTLGGDGFSTSWLQFVAP